MEKLVLIDGNSLINRAFYAMPLLTTKKGEYTNAVYGFMNMLFKIFSDIKPDYLAVAFDLKAPTFRHKIYSEYKGTRKPMPEELRPQISLLKETLKLMNIAVIEKEGVEADDIIGTIAKHTDIMTYIFTGDKDALQLVDAQTEVHFTRRGITDVEIYTAENFCEKTTLSPFQIIELKALMGDSSDNIPGIPGVGEKTALSLLSTYTTVDNLYQNTQELSGKLKDKIINGKDLCYLSKTLATINTDCGVDCDTSKMTVNLPFPYAVRKRFNELEFKSLGARSNFFSTEESVSEPRGESASVNKIFIESLDEITKEKLYGKVSVTVSGNSINVYNGETELEIHIKQNLLDDGFNLSDILNALNNAFTDATELILFNKKEFMHLLSNTLNVRLKSKADDVAIMKYLADFNNGAETLETVITEYGESIETPACSLFNIYTLLKNKLTEQNTFSLYLDVELPLVDVLFSMEQSGFKVDYNALLQAGETYRARLNSIEHKIRELTGEQNVNINSPKQLGDLLFEKLKIGKGKKTKTGYSTSAEVLENLDSAHPVVPLILEFRRIQKLLSTYIEGFKPLIDKNSGLIHTSFNQTVTATGRLSSKEPNLQNIPVRDDEGRELRKFFVPKSDDRILIGADYSQIELRLLADFSECEPLISAFNSEIDIHSITASKVFNVDMSSVTPQMRRDAKAVNFGIIYGISEYGLAKNIKVSPAEAKAYITKYFNQYPEIKRYMEKNVEFAKANGYAVTYLGRRRYIRELNSSNYMLRQFGERAAMNMPLQGSSADIIKLAMLGVYKRLKSENLKSELILQIHDELIVDTYNSEKERVEKILVEEMQNAVKLSVPLTVSVGSGKNWYEAK